jgi:hypothetical protein
MQIAQSNIPIPNYDGVNIKQSFYGSTALGNQTAISGIINAILPNIYIVSGVILFIYLIFGGFMFIASGDNPNKADTGKKAMSNAIIGFAIIFVSYWLIQAIEYLTGIPIMSGL